ncbi:MAG: ATP-binding protein [Archaeoglobaceae archaeon]
MNNSISEDTISEKLSRCEWIGVVGSPSSNTTITVDLLETAYQRGVIGNPCILEFLQDGRKNYAIGQIVSVQLRNPHIERHPIQKIISSRGEANPLTGEHDIRRLEIEVGTVYTLENGVLKPSRMSSVPPTGTRVYFLNEETLNGLLENFRKEIFYIGRMYNTDIPIPMIFRDFGPNGAGEAYHIGIFGKTGSGKSILAIMMMLAYARHKDMSIIVLDPQGQFAQEINRPEIRKLLETFSRSFEVVNVSKLNLDKIELFKEILIKSKFLERFCSIIHEDNQRKAADQIVRILKNQSKTAQIKLESSQKRSFRLEEFYLKDAFELVWDELSENKQIQMNIYTMQEPRDRMIYAIQNSDREEVYREWKRVANLFAKTQNSRTIKELVEQTLKERKIVVLDLSEIEVPPDKYWNDQIKLVVLKEFFNELISKAGEMYKMRRSLLNTIVILDEAHRFAPREKTEDEFLEQVKNTLIDGVRTTRKYGLGWMFISQTLSSLHREILNQLRIFFFGFGLAWGIEGQALRELIGGAEDSFNLYRSFPDPQSLGYKEYPFMATGPVSPLSSSGMPIFFTALKYPEQFLKVNNLPIHRDKNE